MTEPSSNAINRLTEAMAANREVTDRQLRALATMVEQTTQNVDRALEGMRQSTERIERHVDRALEGMQQSADRIEHQVGVMSEHLTAIDLKIERLTDKIERLADRIDELTKAINGHLEVAKQQSTNIAELTKLVATQANTVAMLISRTG
jgi:archaellum component FlaC